MDTINFEETLDTLNGEKYKIIKSLGDGLTAEVKLAINTVTSAKVAIKILKDPIYLDYFKLEIAAQRKLSHPNILKMIEYG